MFRGSIVALVTPFKDGELDEARAAQLAEFHLASGTHGIVAAGTTGEAPTLTEDERARLIRRIISVVRGRMPVIAGCGSNDTKKSIRSVQLAEECGAEAALVVTPYYNRPTQEGLFRHFEAVAKGTRLPVILYNVPSRTAVNLLPETVSRLARIGNVAAIKEASGSLEQVTQIRAMSHLTILSGDDALTFPILCLGGTGVISVAANVIPREMANLVEEFEASRLDKSRDIHVRAHGLFKALFLETNPIPVKAAMKMMNLASGELRLPLVEMSPANQEKLREALADHGLLRPARKKSVAAS